MPPAKPNTTQPAPAAPAAPAHTRKTNITQNDNIELMSDGFILQTVVPHYDVTFIEGDKNSLGFPQRSLRQTVFHHRLQTPRYNFGTVGLNDTRTLQGVDAKA